MSIKTTANKKAKDAVKEAEKISKFISKWQSKNPYNRAKLAEYNLKFRKDFTAFCKKSKISAKERDWYLK
ncbi:hypothetical protein [Algibacter sp. PT7-4]|uniref:hypothetical protein n=1 Tax=Algibacter ulvanivorans TaxID=3400999 RepID=UPI003AAC01CE